LSGIRCYVLTAKLFWYVHYADLFAKGENVPMSLKWIQSNPEFIRVSFHMFGCFGCLKQKWNRIVVFVFCLTCLCRLSPMPCVSLWTVCVPCRQFWVPTKLSRVAGLEKVEAVSWISTQRCYWWISNRQRQAANASFSVETAKDVSLYGNEYVSSFLIRMTLCSSYCLWAEWMYNVLGTD